MSGIVETTYGYHIILRLDPASEKIAATIVDQRVTGQTNQMVSDWMEEHDLETTELFDRFDSKIYYEALCASRAAAEAADK